MAIRQTIWLFSSVTRRLNITLLVRKIQVNITLTNIKRITIANEWIPIKKKKIAINQTCPVKEKRQQ